MEVEFVTSAPDLAGRPETVLPEFAFIGRSNCGKSSLINHFLERTRMAKTSGKPGKTQISYKFQYGTTEMTSEIPLQTSYGQGWNGSASTTSRYSWGPELTAGTPVYNHATDVSDGGYLYEHNVTVSGGNDMTTFFLSAGRYFEEGHWEAGSSYRRTTFRLKGSQVVKR